jgi:hypothetical protein
MISTAIKDKRTGKTLSLGVDGEANVVIHGHPPLDSESVLQIPFSQFFTTDGTATGSRAMNVNGATTNQSFFVGSDSNNDLYITSLTVQISDSGSTLEKFGGITALTNGVQFIYRSSNLGEFILADDIKSNLDFFRDATEGKGFGGKTDAWLADIKGGGGEDTYFPEFDLRKRYGLHYGLKISRGTRAELIYKVRDNLIGLNIFNIKAHGFRLIKND